ncbi:MAG: superoxide dismutase family protein, partial [Gramella sp.]|nr:superoxide dismutase family protein [Christiangramia sp.]
MKRISLSLILCAGLIFTGCKNDKKEKEMDDQSETEMTSEKETEKEEVKKVKVTLKAVSDSNLSGNVVFTEENGEVSMTAIISGLAEG